jgi:hypothetical protein
MSKTPFEKTRTAELFEAAAARKDDTAMLAQLVAMQLLLIITIKDKELSRKLEEGLNLIIHRTAPEIVTGGANSPLVIAGNALSRDLKDIFPQR